MHEPLSKQHLYDAHCDKERHSKMPLPLFPFGTTSHRSSFSYSSGNYPDPLPAKVCPIPEGGFELILNPVIGTD